MMKDVKMLIKKNPSLKIFILIIGTLILGCGNGEKIYLDYNEVIFHSYQKDIMEKNSSFVIYNEKDVIHLYRADKGIKTRKLDYFKKIRITPIDTAIKRLSKITFDNLSIEKEKGLPQLFIVKKDSLNNEIKIIQVGQSFVISEDNFDIDKK